jgi:hypothetical protein
MSKNPRQRAMTYLTLFDDNINKFIQIFFGLEFWCLGLDQNTAKLPLTRDAVFASLTGLSRFRIYWL